MKLNKKLLFFLYSLGFLGLFPWYGSPFDHSYMGLPLWVLLSLSSAFYLSVLTALVLYLLVRAESDE
jgi:hypothetical protein